MSKKKSDDEYTMRLDSQKLDVLYLRVPYDLASKVRAAAAYDRESLSLWAISALEKKLEMYSISKL